MNELGLSSTEGSTWSPTEEAVFSGAESTSYRQFRMGVRKDDGRS